MGMKEDRANPFDDDDARTIDEKSEQCLSVTASERDNDEENRIRPTQSEHKLAL